MLLSLSVVLPLFLLIIIKDKLYAAQIGDVLGGVSAPLMSISAILAVIATYYYQRRNDQRNARRELVVSNFNFLISELNNIDHVVSITSKGTTEVLHKKGRESIQYIIRSLNNGEYKNFDIRKLDTFSPILNVYKYLDLLIKDVKDDFILLDADKELFLAQFSLFYRNNLFINKQLRGDEI